MKKQQLFCLLEETKMDLEDEYDEDDSDESTHGISYGIAYASGEFDI